MTLSKEEDFIIGFLFLCIICHGMFFVREWLILGSILITAGLFFRYKKYKKARMSITINFMLEEISIRVKNYFGKMPEALLEPISFFVLMIILSLTGLFQPIRSIEGYMEAFRWLIFLTAYLWGKNFSAVFAIKEKILDRLIWIAFIAALLTWIPGGEFIWLSSGPPEEGRFGLSFGYPNAAAVFLGCHLLLISKDKNPNILFLMVFGISLLCTGSRAGLSLLIFLGLAVVLKKVLIYWENKKQTADGKRLLSFYNKPFWVQDFVAGKATKKNIALKFLIMIVLILLMQHIVLRYQASLQHLLNWTDSSLSERIVYYLDSIKIACQAYFLPRAGGWLAFPFVQNISYWTLDPHSSICRIMLNQGLAGVVILAIWAIRGIKGYIIDLLKSKQLSAICTKTAILYLGLHSLIDVDMCFGALGILFWLLIGIECDNSNA